MKLTPAGMMAELILGISLPSPDTRPTDEGTVGRQRTAHAGVAAVDAELLVGLEVLDDDVL